MTIELFFWNFLSVVFSLLAFYLFKSYWPKYFEAKGANKAMKEDIGTITQIVESIKSDLLKQNEFIKAQLSFNNQHRLNLKTAEREALFDFYKRKSAWLYSVLNFNYSPYDFDNYKELKTVSADFSKKQYEADLADAQVTLFLHDQDFIELRRDFNTSIIELQHIVEKSMRKYYWINSKCEFDIELDKRNDTKKEFEIRGRLYNELNPIIESHSKDTLEQFEKFHDLNVKMIYLINKRLNEIENETLANTNFVKTSL